MKITKYAIAMLAALSLWSCSEEDFSIYEPGTKAGIFIQRVASTTYDNTGSTKISETYTDSTAVSFASVRADIMEQNDAITVRLMGDTVGYDREFILKVDESKSTAVRGTHFDFDVKDCVIKAGQASAKVPVKFYRHNDLVTKTLVVVFKLEANNNFTLELEQFRNSSLWNSISGKMLCGSVYKYSMSEKYSEPSYWGSFGEDYWGKWSATKEKMVNAIMGWSHSDWSNAGFSGAKIALGKFAYAARKLHDQLQEAADKGTPVYDEDGEYMQLSDSYAVDYSHLK